MNKKNLLFVIIIFFFLTLSNLFMINNNILISMNNFKTSDASNINLDETSLTVSYGTNIQEDRPYTFSGAFYDITDDLRVWSEATYLETQFVLDPDVYSNDSITDLDNTEIQSPENDSISMTSGTQYQNGTLDQLDDDYAIFNSTDDNYVESTNFTINYGEEISTGNLTEIDGDYSEYQSIYETSLAYVDNFTTNNGSFLQNGTIFPATYSFTDDVIGGNPSGWSVFESVDRTVDVVGLKEDHKMVLEFDDSDAGTESTITQSVSNIIDGSLEFWMMSDSINSDDYFFMYLQDSGTVGIQFGMNHGYFKYVDSTPVWVSTGISYVANKWYHIRLDFETGSGSYLGLSADTFYLKINGVNCGAYGNYNPITKVDLVRIQTASTLVGHIDAIGYSWDSNYDIGDNRYSNDADLNNIDNDYMVYQSVGKILNITSRFQFDVENRDLAIFHSLKTNISQTINISLYNFDTEQFDVVNSSNSLDFTIDHFVLNSSYHNVTNYMILNVVGINSTYDFYLYFEMLYIRDSSILEIETIIECSLLDNLVYSYSTNITQSVELYLYNFTSGSYELIENQSYTSFFLNYTALSSDYHNGTAMKVKFRAVNTTYNDFILYLEVLKVVNITRLDFTHYTNLDFIQYLLNFNCSAWYNTSIYTIMNFSIYDFENSEWILINSSYNDAFHKSEYNDNAETLYDLIDIDNDNQVLLRFEALNNTNDFDFFLDCLNITIHRKLVLSYSKTFTLLGTWKYRFHIPEDDYSSSWYYFDVVQHADNFMAISESPYITKWVLINNETEISTSRRFIDDIDGTYDWNLITETDNELELQGIAQVTFVDAYYPTTNRGYYDFGSIGIENGYERRVFFLFDYTTDTTYFYENHTSSVYKFRTTNTYDNHYIGMYVYTVGTFSETGITWNTQTAPIGGYLSYYPVQWWYYGTWYEIDLGSTPYIYYSIRNIGASNEFLNTYSDDNTWWKPTIIHHYSKSYINPSGGYWYMQTDETETLTMKSEQFNDVSLKANDYFTIDCHASVENIQLQLLHDGSVVDTIDVLKNNVDEDRQIIEVSVDDDVVFDQLQFTGLFDDTEYFKCYSVRADGYDINTREQTTTTYIAPEESESLLLSTGEHLLKIYDSDILRVNKWINITHDMQDNLEIYQPIYITNCRLALIDQDNSLLDFSLFEVYATRTLHDISSRIPLLDEFFDADQGTTIKFEFYDRFGDFIKNETKEVQTYLYIEIETYSLKIKNDATNQSDITITKSGSSIEIQDILAPDELKEYLFISGEYFIEWMNHENDELKTYNISLDSDHILTLPTVFKDIYFAPFLADGTGLSHEILRFYINGSRKDFGFNTISSIFINITVLDYFNQTAYSEIIDTTGLNEYNIYIELYSFKIQNKATETANYTLSKGSIYENGDILVDEIIEYLLVSGNYNFYHTNNENGETHLVSVNLVEDYVLTINTSYYQIYFSAFLINGLGLDNDAVRFYINGTRKDFGYNIVKSSYINLTVLDFFNQTAYEEILHVIGVNEYNIFINLKSLKIQNRAIEIVNYTLTKNSLTQSGNILPDEIIEYFFISGDYVLEYTNQENMETDITTISLTKNVVFMINTTYHQVYFSVYNYDGLGLDGSLFRFYINGLRKDFGFNTLSQDTNNLVVKDYFNATLKDITVDLSGYTEYNIIVEVYTIFVLNNYNRTIKIEIERENSPITLEQIIPSRSGLEYRFLPNIEYTVSAYEQNGTLLDSETFTLDSQYMIVDFGFYHTVVPLDPTPIIADLTLLMWFVFFVMVIAIILIILVMRYRKKDKSIPIEIQQYLKKNKKKRKDPINVMDDRDFYR